MHFERLFLSDKKIIILKTIFVTWMFEKNLQNYLWYLTVYLNNIILNEKNIPNNLAKNTQEYMLFNLRRVISSVL